VESQTSWKAQLTHSVLKKSALFDNPVWRETP
jgi:hypothetical protein